MDNSNPLAGLLNPSGMSMPGIPGMPGMGGGSTTPSMPGSNPYDQPPPSINSALHSAKTLGHINEQQLLQSSLEAVVSTAELKLLRPLQKESFLCSAKCCDDETGSQQNFQRCQQKCNINVQRASQMFQHELQRFQQRIQRQAADCQESARDMQLSGSSDGGAEKVYKECTDQVFGKNRRLIPELNARLTTMLTPQTSPPIPPM